MNQAEMKIIKKKKSDITAENEYQYSRLERAKFYFIPCSVEEKDEEVSFTYQMECMRSVEELKKGKSKAWKYGILCQVLEAVLYAEDYDFSLNPENLFLDRQGRVRIQERDISKGRETKEILQETLALAGYLLQKKYGYEDYMQGGISLLGKARATKSLVAVNSLEEAYTLFKEKQMEEQERQERDYIWCKKRGRKIQSIVMYTALTVATLLAGIFTYQYVAVLTPQKHALMAERANLEQNPVEVIAAMETVPVEKMDRHEKFLLASAYINGQVVDSFTNETKELLLSRLAYNSDEILLDYWIYLGRRQVDQAIDIAMRRSDNQLLLYAYLLKMDRVSEDVEMTGEEKEQQLSELKGKVKTLADNLGIGYGEGAAGGE